MENRHFTNTHKAQRETVYELERFNQELFHKDW